MRREICLVLGCLATLLVPGIQSANCPVDWQEFGSWCHRAFPEAKMLSWFEGNLLCEMYDGQLAEPSTAEISNHLFQIAKKYPEIDNWYLGLSDMAEEGNWIGFYSGEKPENYFWGSGYPDKTDNNGLDCAIMSMGAGGYSWQDVGCVGAPGGETSPICQIKRLVQCPEGSSEFSGNCYKYVDEKMSLLDAESVCNDAGGHLASVHSPEENEFIRTLDGHWDRLLGAVLLDHDSWTWAWLDGTPFDFPGVWPEDGHEPSDKDNVIAMVEDGEWFGRHGSDATDHFVCKIKG